MRPKKQINARQMADDVRSGLADSQLMDKYELSAKGLQSVFQKLIEAGVVTETELEDRVPFSQLTADLSKVRDLPRNYTVFRVPIYDAMHDRLLGRVVDVTEKGLKVIGQKVEAGTKMHLIVQCPDLLDFVPIEFEAICRWSKSEEEGSFAGGFEITKIEERHLSELRKMIEMNAFTRFDW